MMIILILEREKASRDRSHLLGKLVNGMPLCGDSQQLTPCTAEDPSALALTHVLLWHVIKINKAPLFLKL